MKAEKYLKNAYAVLLAAACIAGGAGALYLAAAGAERSAVLLCVCGVLASVFFAPFFHEAGHIVFAKANGFSVLYVKIFMFRMDNTGEKKRFSLCSPFASEQTQAAPAYAEKRPGDMKKRAALYTSGGLAFGGAFLCIAAVFAAAFAGRGGAAGGVSYFCLGVLPYAAYLFFLNVAPFTYGGGKTDMRVLIDILKQTPFGVRFLAALNAQGQIAEGKAYSEIDAAYLKNLPAIAEDEPLFIMNLFYLYYAAAEKGEAESAAGYINRIAALAPYLTPQEEKSALCELLYMNAVSGDEEQAQKCFSALCTYGETATAAENRAAAAYYVMRGDTARADEYISRAVAAARKEKISGGRKSEELLLRQTTGGRR